MQRIGTPIAAIAVLAQAACGGGGAGEGTAEPPASSPTRAACTSEAAFADSDWAYPNYDLAGSRATFASTISSANVAKLDEAWRYELPSGGAFGAAATTPTA